MNTVVALVARWLCPHLKASLLLILKLLQGLYMKNDGNNTKFLSPDNTINCQDQLCLTKQLLLSFSKCFDLKYSHLLALPPLLPSSCLLPSLSHLSPFPPSLPPSLPPFLPPLSPSPLSLPSLPPLSPSLPILRDWTVNL